MSTLAPRTGSSESAALTPDIIAQIHAEIDKIKRYDKNGNLIMTMDSLGLTGDIRYVVVNGLPGLCRLDLVMIGANMTNIEARHWIQYNLSDSETTNEVAEKLGDFTFKGRGQQKTRLLTVDQAIGILEKLPGPNGKRISDHIRKLGRRVVAGDQRMHEVIDSNARNEGDVHVMARVATVIDAVENGEAIPSLAVTQGDLKALEERLFGRFTTDVSEVENRLVKRCPTIAEVSGMKQELIDGFIKSDKSKRRMKLNDDAREHKRKMELIEKETIEMGKRLPIAEHFDAIEERKFQRKMQLLEKEEAIKKMAPVPTEQIPPKISGKFTTSNVAECYNIYDGLDMRRKQRVFNIAWRAMMEEPYNLQPLGYVEETVFGKKEPYFHCKDVYIMKSVLDNTRKEVLAGPVD